MNINKTVINIDNILIKNYKRKLIFLLWVLWSERSERNKIQGAGKENQLTIIIIDILSLGDTPKPPPCKEKENGKSHSLETTGHR